MYSCDLYAPMELSKARSISKDNLDLMTNRGSSGIRFARTNYYDLPHTIASTLALCDEMKSTTYQKQRVQIDYLLTLKCNLHLRLKICVAQLAKALCNVDLDYSEALSKSPPDSLNYADSALKSKKHFLSTLVFPQKESTLVLLETGLTEDILEALAFSFGYHHSNQLNSIVEEVNKIKLDRYIYANSSQLFAFFPLSFLFLMLCISIGDF